MWSNVDILLCISFHVKHFQSVFMEVFKTTSWSLNDPFLRDRRTVLKPDVLTYCGAPLWSPCPGSTTPPRAPGSWSRRRPPPPSLRDETPAATERHETWASLEKKLRLESNVFFIFCKHSEPFTKREITAVLLQYRELWTQGLKKLR